MSSGQRNPLLFKSPSKPDQIVMSQTAVSETSELLGPSGVPSLPDLQVSRFEHKEEGLAEVPSLLTRIPQLRTV